MSETVFLDLEVGVRDNKIHDIGAVRTNGSGTEDKVFHGSGLHELEDFMRGADYVCGHNLFDFDSGYVKEQITAAGVRHRIDTLYLSALLFPQKPYHRLLKDEKLIVEELNNPLNDAKKCRELFEDELNAFGKLDDRLKDIYYSLLFLSDEFADFFEYTGYKGVGGFSPEKDIRSYFEGRICTGAKLSDIAAENPVELAYVLASVSTDDRESIIPRWVKYRFHRVEDIYDRLRNHPCRNGCPYCTGAFDIHRMLSDKFGYPSYREYEGEPLQERCVMAAVRGESLLAVFPTGGGKSITFQVPALIQAESVRGLTVVISPLQSLMKDQVDNLQGKGIFDAVTINGQISLPEKAAAIESVVSGRASILYIAPESLRSRTIEHILIGRHIARFVIDEAHCFSAWGQDFRVDYLYIADYIAHLEKIKECRIPVSCFTATAKKEVIEDICAYFREKLGVELSLYTTDAQRRNLRYRVLYQESDEAKYRTLRSLLEGRDCPSIIYTSRTKRTEELAGKLCSDGIEAVCYHGKMDRDEKIRNQELFMSGEVNVIVATSAFGMGVDKSDVGLVIHYDISDSLENYVQEAGRAGRDENLNADCFVLYNENDLDKHFMLLNQTKLSFCEIQQVWSAIKRMSGNREELSCSALELATGAGWDDQAQDVETKAVTALNALEQSGYVRRGNNSPRVYADSIKVRSLMEARERMRSSGLFDEKSTETAVRIFSSLISERSRSLGDDPAESRVDHMAAVLGLEREYVTDLVGMMRMSGILSDDKEMYAFIPEKDIRRKNKSIRLGRLLAVERFLMDYVLEQDGWDGFRADYKKINEAASEKNIECNIRTLRNILYFWTLKGYIRKPGGNVVDSVYIEFVKDHGNFSQKLALREKLSFFIDDYLRHKAKPETPDQRVGSEGEENRNEPAPSAGKQVYFSLIELRYAAGSELKTDIGIKDVEETLLYLSKMGLVNIDGGFLVIYNALTIKRLVMNNHIMYKKDEYSDLEAYYKNKTRMIHIVGEYADIMVRDYRAALTFVAGYFNMESHLFLAKYFTAERREKIDANISPRMYDRLYKGLTEDQKQIMSDNSSPVIVVAAGPGSGKTRVLVHKLASLLLLEDVKHDQLLMLTFSRAAAVEFQIRLRELIGNAAYFVEIRTFHSFAFDLLGRTGKLEGADDVIGEAAVLIRSGEAQEGRITKTVLVIDEAQDMSPQELSLVEALAEYNSLMRIVAVGDDDQNIFSFRGSDPRYMAHLLDRDGAVFYEMVDNFRSTERIVAFADRFVASVRNRMKYRELVSKREGNGGCLWLVKNDTALEGSAVNLIKNTYEKDVSNAVLTTTNEQAGIVYDLLKKEGFSPRLIRSVDGFKVSDTDEIRFLISRIDPGINAGPVVDKEKWEEAVGDLKKLFDRSFVLENILFILDKFRKANRRLYFREVREFLDTIRLEDFYESRSGDIVISTLHKAKGHEFDTVYLICTQGYLCDDESRRAVYVGMTRARDRLYILHSADEFRYIAMEETELGIKCYNDGKKYEKSKLISISMGLKDVWLSFNNGLETEEYGEVQSGDPLSWSTDAETGRLFFYLGERRVCASSVSFSDDLKKRYPGYMITEARVGFVVHWEKDRDKRRVVLPELRVRIR